MSDSSIKSAALTAAKTAAKTLAVSAHNVANANTPGFKASRVTAKEVPGGVAAEITPTDAPPAMVTEAGELVTLSNTDLVEESITQIRALAQYRAAMALIETGDELEEDAIDTVA